MTALARVRTATGLRHGEGGLVGLIAATFATLEAGRGLGEVGVNTLVLDRIGADILPVLYIPLGVVSMLVAVALGAALGRVRRARLFGGLLLGFGALLAGEWLLIGANPVVIPIAWLTVMTAGAISLTVGWTVAGSSLDARQAKRLYPLCTAAAIGGAFAGNLGAGRVAAIAGAELLILLEAVAFAIAALLITRLAARHGGPGWAARRASARSIVADVRTGADIVTRSSLLRLVAVAYVLFSVLAFSVSFPYFKAAEAAFPNEAELAGVLGLVSAAVMATSFVVSLVVAKPFYARFGVAAAALTLPVAYLAGFGLWLVRFSFPLAAATTYVQQVLQRGLSNAAWSAFYNVIPAAGRAQAMAFNDGVPGQLGIVLSGVLLLAAGSVLRPDQVFWLGLLAAALCTAIVVAIRRRYADALLRTLRAGIGEQLLEGGPGLGDLLRVPDVRAALVTALGSPEPAGRSFAATLLAKAGTEEARIALARAVEDPDPAVAGIAVTAVLRSGGATGPDDLARAEERLATLLAGDERERVAGLRALHDLGRELPLETRRQCLAHPAPAVRAMTLTVLVRSRDAAAATTLIAGLRDPEPLVRRAAAAALAERETVDPRTVEALADPSLDVQEAAIAALDGHGEALREPIIVWATARVERALERLDLRARLGRDGTGAADGSDSSDGSIAFLDRVLDHRIRRDQELALRAMAVLGAPAASGVIRRCLSSDDADIRAQAIEALDSIGDRRLGSAITRLVDYDPGRVTPDRAAVLDQLRDDDDPWVRGLARRIRPTGDVMADATSPLGDIDTMLRLRRVSLFAQLAPEDLQRVAMVAESRTWAPGEVVVREGEAGDTLIVILEGSVVVTRRGADGSERRIRTYGVGDHFGELAVLRDRPRVATVTVEQHPLTALVVDGIGLKAILRERPDAAMAMLATLAERLSSQ